MKAALAHRTGPPARPSEARHRPVQTRRAGKAPQDATPGLQGEAKQGTAQPGTGPGPGRTSERPTAALRRRNKGRKPALPKGKARGEVSSHGISTRNNKQILCSWRRGCPPTTFDIANLFQIRSLFPTDFPTVSAQIPASPFGAGMAEGPGFEFAARIGLRTSNLNGRATAGRDSAVRLAIRAVPKTPPSPDRLSTGFLRGFSPWDHPVSRSHRQLLIKFAVWNSS